MWVYFRWATRVLNQLSFLEKKDLEKKAKMYKVKAKRSVFNKKEDYFNKDYIEYKIHCIRGTGNDADDDKVVRIRDILDLEVWIDAKLEESDFQV